MNIKSLKLRIANKKLKIKLKEYKNLISSKDNINLSLAARKDVGSNLIRHLEDVIENQNNEAKHLNKENTEYMHKYYALLQKNYGIERDLTAYKNKLDTAAVEVINSKQLIKKYEENINILSIKVVSLTNESKFKRSGFANKLKNILGIR